MNCRQWSCMILGGAVLLLCVFAGGSFAEEDVDEVLRDIGALARENPQFFVRLCRMAAEEYRNNGETDKAIALYEKGLTVTDEPDRSLMQEIAMLYETQDKLEEAIGVYEKLCAQYPDETGYLNSLASLYQRDGNVDKAVEVWEIMVQRNPSDYYGLMQLATIYVEKGETESAVAMMNKAMNAAPEDARLGLKLQIADIYLNAEQNDIAISQYEEILEDSESGGEENKYFAREAAQRITDIYRREGRTSELVDLYTTWLEKNPGNPELYLGLGTFYEHEGESDKALEIYQKGTAAVSDRNLSLALIGVYEHMQKWDEAVTECEKLIEQNPEETLYHETLSGIYSSQGDHDKAIAVLEDMTERFPERMDVKMRYADVLFQQQQYDQSAKILQELIDAESRDFSYYQRLADVYLAAQEINKAKAVLNKAREEIPEDWVNEEVERKLAEIEQHSSDSVSPVVE